MIDRDLDIHGFCVIPQLLSKEERGSIRLHRKERDSEILQSSAWPKGRAAADPFYHRLVSDEKFLALLRPLLGSDIIHWGLDILTRRPGEVHPWHCDMESCTPAGGFISIWIGLSHTSVRSSLKLISRSHRFDCTVQQDSHQHGSARGEASDETILGWAKERDPQAELVVPKLRNGDALIFDGRLWHGSCNTQRWFTRRAILMQYARSDRSVRMPLNFDWPLRLNEAELPPVIVVSGTASSPCNRLVPPPKEAQA